MKEILLEKAEALRVVVPALAKGIRLSGFSPRGGLCWNLDFDSDLRDIFPRWPKYSGDVDYPVPSPDGFSAEHEFALSRCMYCGEYGALRIELLDFIIETLKEEIAKWLRPQLKPRSSSPLFRPSPSR